MVKSKYGSYESVSEINLLFDMPTKYINKIQPKRRILRQASSLRQLRSCNRKKIYSPNPIIKFKFSKCKAPTSIIPSQLNYNILLVSPSQIIRCCLRHNGGEIDQINSVTQFSQFSFAWEFIKSGYGTRIQSNKQNETHRILRKQIINMISSIFVRSRNQFCHTIFSYRIGFFFYRIACKKLLWNILSSLRITLHYSTINSFLNSIDTAAETIKVLGWEGPEDIAMIGADNNQFFIKTGDQRTDFMSRYLLTITWAEIMPKLLEGKQLLDVGLDQEAEDISDISLLLDSFSKNNYNSNNNSSSSSSNLSISPIRAIEVSRNDSMISALDVLNEEAASADERVQIPDISIQIANRESIQRKKELLIGELQNFYSDIQQQKIFSERISAANIHILSGKAGESRSLLDYPCFQFFSTSCSRTNFVVHPPELNCDPKSKEDCSIFLSTVRSKYSTKKYVLLFGDENFIKVCASIKMERPGDFSWLLLFPGELHFRIHCCHAIYRIFGDKIIFPISEHLGRQSIKKDFTTSGFNMHEDNLLVIIDAVFKYFSDSGVNPSLWHLFLRSSSRFLADLAAFIMYAGLPYWNLVYSIRSNNTDGILVAWKSFLPLFELSNKKNYFNLACQAIFMQLFAPPGIKQALKHRLISYSGIHNQWMGTDHLIEMVRLL